MVRHAAAMARCQATMADVAGLAGATGNRDPGS